MVKFLNFISRPTFKHVTIEPFEISCVKQSMQSCDTLPTCPHEGRHFVILRSSCCCTLTVQYIQYMLRFFTDTRRTASASLLSVQLPLPCRDSRKNVSVATILVQFLSGPGFKIQLPLLSRDSKKNVNVATILVYQAEYRFYSECKCCRTTTTQRFCAVQQWSTHPQ